MKSDFAHMSLEINVSCPYKDCAGFFNLFNIEELTEDGLLYDLVCPSDRFWGCTNLQEELDRIGIKIRCPECGRVVEVESVEW